MELTQQEQQFFETGGETPLEAQETPAAAPAETPAETPAPAAETPPEPPKEPEKPKVVPLEALHEARGIQRELREQLRRSEESRASMEKRFSELMERLSPAKPQTPAFEENPAEHLRTRVEQTQEQLQRLAQSQEQQTREAQFQNWYRAQAAQFSAQQQDFLPAYESFISTRARELQEHGLGQQEITERVRLEERQLAISAAQIGMNPAQMIYQAALAKGYKPAANDTAPKFDARAPSPAEKLQNVAEGIKSSKSLSSVPGKPSENLTLEYIANLPDHEFAKYAKDWEGTMSRLSS